jgi:uncharacterized protein YpiB (UPF0302 family)
MAVVHKDVYKALVDAGVPKNTAETIASADRAEREVSREATQVLIVQYLRKIDEKLDRIEKLLSADVDTFDAPGG